MSIRILNQEKNSIEIDLGDVDLSVPQLIVERLYTSPDVEFVAHKRDHPIIGTPCLILRTKKGNPVELLVETLEGMQKDIRDFKKQFSIISK